jgi:hypothetical protein
LPDGADVDTVDDDVFEPISLEWEKYIPKSTNTPISDNELKTIAAFFIENNLIGSKVMPAELLSAFGFS